MESTNMKEEASFNINFCPYCGSDVLKARTNTEMYCMDFVHNPEKECLR